MDNKDTNATLRLDARMWLGFVLLPAVFAVAIVAGAIIFRSGINRHSVNANVAMAVGALVVAAGGVGIALSWAATSHNVGLPARESEQIGEDDGSSPLMFDTDREFTPAELLGMAPGPIVLRGVSSHPIDDTLGNTADLVRMIDERLSEIRECDALVDGTARWRFAAIDLRNIAQAMGVDQPTYLGFDATELDQAERRGEYPMPDEG